MALYSAFVVDWATADCFFDFNDIKDEPKNTQKPVLDCLEIRAWCPICIHESFSGKVELGKNNP